jgi:hypothetical protein
MTRAAYVTELGSPENIRVGEPAGAELPVASLPRSPAVAMGVLVAKDSNA